MLNYRHRLTKHTRDKRRGFEPCFDPSPLVGGHSAKFMTRVLGSNSIVRDDRRIKKKAKGTPATTLVGPGPSTTVPGSQPAYRAEGVCTYKPGGNCWFQSELHLAASGFLDSRSRLDSPLLHIHPRASLASKQAFPFLVRKIEEGRDYYIHTHLGQLIVHQTNAPAPSTKIASTALPFIQTHAIHSLAPVFRGPRSISSSRGGLVRLFLLFFSGEVT
jgi:hypothetical protein